MERKILAVASGGGHWIQLKRLRPSFEGLDVAYVSVLASNGEEVPGHRYYTVTDASRAGKFKFLILIVQCFSILLRERPQVVITTGAGPGLIMLMLAKTFFGARTMWIDSIANSEQLSLSGRKAERFADVWLTQWPALVRNGRPDYWGSVL